MALPGETEAGSAGKQPCPGIVRRAHRDDDHGRGNERLAPTLHPIGSKDPDALKIPARRAASTLTRSVRSPVLAEPAHLVEGKNGAVVRKHMGHEPIGARHAGQVQLFYTADFNPYLNYHRPCGFARVELSATASGAAATGTRTIRTPYEKLLSLNDWESCLQGRHQRGQAGATGAADERHRMRAGDAATQKKTARRLPLTVLELPKDRNFDSIGPPIR